MKTVASNLKLVDGEGPRVSRFTKFPELIQVGPDDFAGQVIKLVKFLKVANDDYTGCIFFKWAIPGIFFVYFCLF